MLSALSRGYGTWNGELDVYGEAPEKTALPDVEHERHKHGVTITPRTQGRGFPYPSQPHPKDDGCLELPKTYLTRKGALLLFSAPDAPPEKDHVRPRLPRKRKQQELIDLSLKLGTLERLSLSVLQYGDQGFDRENSSISDKENRWFLKFMRQLNTPDTVVEEGGDPLTDRRAQPGADLKVYLQDLKQRASSRCYGRESSLSSRARSQELRDILQQLEDAWPSGLSQPLSQAPTSFTDGSHFGPEEFFYPRSPSLSSESSRAFSGRAKVLSSHKLTASLKSLNYLGRPQSTEPGDQARSVTSPELVIPHGHLSHTRRSKSGYWSGTADIPDLRKRPQSSYHGSRQPFSTERQRVASADGMAPLEESVPVIKEETADERSSSGSRAISVQVSSPLGYPVDGSEHVLMSRVIQKEAEMDRASVSSSLQQEDDILLPLDADEGGVGGREEDWPEGTKEAVLAPNETDSLAKPLQPQYSGVLQDSEMLQDYEEDKLRKSEQGSRPGSQAGSVASLKMRDVYRPSSVMSSRAASRADMLPEEEEEEVDQEGLDELMAEGTAQGQETSEQKMDAYLLDHVAKQLEKQEKYASSFSGSVDRPEPDPETLISLQGGGIVISSSSVKSESDGQTDVLQRLPATPEPKTVPSAPTPEPKLVSPTPTSEPKELSPTPTPEPKSATVTPAVNEVQKKVEAENEEVKPESEEVKPVVAKAEQVMDSVSIKTEGEKDVKSSSDLDNMAMAEAGFQAVPPPRPPSRSASPVLSSSIPPPDITVEVSTSKQEPASVSEPVPEPVTAPPKEVKPAPEKVEKLAAKTPHPPSKKPGAARQKSPSKGGKVDIKGKNNKSFVKAMDISSAQPDQAETEVSATPAPKAKESPKKKESYRPPPPPPRVKTPAEKPSLIIPEHMKEALVRRDSISKNELENELMRMHKVMDESLGVSSLITEDSEGLTEEELQQAQQALKERMEEAQRRMNEAVLPDSEKEKPEPTPKKQPEAKAKKGKKVRVMDPKAEEERAQKEAAKEQRRLERQKRLEEAKALQEKISQKEQQRKAKESEADRKARELEEQVELMRAEEDAIQQAEEDAREQLAVLRKTAREEREARRKQELEKKKQYAQARRDKEKQMMEEARKKEQEMLERIADAEMRRAIREEEERKRDEEERLAQERYEEELQEAQLQAEEEELRLQELERQAEEEAFQRIIAEREEAERQREELELQARRMAEEIEHARKEMLEEEQQLEEERRRQEAEEEKRREEEKQRLLELQRLEEEARLKMREGIDQRREWALKRREVNIDRKKHLDGLRQTQGITEPWTYSYFIIWPRESYCRPMGVSIQEQSKGKKGPKKK